MLVILLRKSQRVTISFKKDNWYKMEGEELRKNILVICLSLMLIMSNYASFVSYANPLDPISDLIPSIDDEAPAPPEKPAEEQLAEDTINKVWMVFQFQQRRQRKI